jgi:hypothetical protein
MNDPDLKLFCHKIGDGEYCVWVRHNAGGIGNLYLSCQKLGVIRNSSEAIVRCGVRHSELAIGHGYSVSSWPSPSICACQSSSRTAIGFSRQFSATLTNSPR